MFRRSLSFSLFCVLAVANLFAADWRAVGPFGGNARALIAEPGNPEHILLGSSAGSMYESTDGGRHWKHFAHLGQGDDLMLENIAFAPSNPKTIYVGAWSVTGSGGGFFVTHDGGKSWAEPAALKGKSVQALVVAPSDPKTLVAGALDGVWRSTDAGESWTRITPEKHADLKNIESLAVDPKDPKTIYAGTWHLPWKTTDGGATWNNIKQGVIDDSDVFSIIIDHANPQNVYASACSGIYKSENAGDLFHKVQGIPGTARRTRVLQQDPVDAQVVYAGTTEGLWKTTDGGKVFKRISPANYILNDVLIDPRNPKRVLIATDRGGVYSSDDAGATWTPSNQGFSQRQITSIVVDPKHHDNLYVGVLNDREFGGVFRSHDGGQSWSQLSEGLAGRDIFDLRQSEDGKLVAATNRGLFMLDSKGEHWEPINTIVHEKPGATRKPYKGKNGKMITPKPAPPIVTRSTFEARANALDLNDDHWFAATTEGLLKSVNGGKSWTGGPVEGEKLFVSVSHNEKRVAAATIREIFLSDDDGEHWTKQSVPTWVTRVYSATILKNGDIWAATREGALVLNHQNGQWEHVLSGLPARNVRMVREYGDTLLATTFGSNAVYVSTDHGKSWTASPASGFDIAGALKVGDTLFAATAYNGLLVREEAERATAGGGAQ